MLLLGHEAASECPILRTPKHCCLIPGVKPSTLTSNNCERRYSARTKGRSMMAGKTGAAGAESMADAESGESTKPATVDAPQGRRLPEGVSGLLLVGVLDWGGVSTRFANQYSVDILTRSPEGRKSMESASGWMADQDGGATPLGRKVLSGAFLPLLDQMVAVLCSYNVGVSSKGVGRLYLTVEDIVALDEIA